MDIAELPPLDGWVPIRIAWKEAPPLVDWCYLGQRRFRESFFEATIETCLRDPFNLLFRHQLPLDSLVEWQNIRPGLKPSGFIFHMSRCGSTLIAQMLAALPQNIVISEAAPIDVVLRIKGQDAAEQQQVAWLRGLLSALGQPRNGENQFFVKFDAWHIFNLPLIRRAFPDVPWIFLYRDPVDVMVSQLKERAVHLVPGLVELGLPGLDVTSTAHMPPEEYCARALACICNAGLEQLRTGGGRAVNYSELPDVVCTSLKDYFRLDCTAADLDQMRNVTQFDAKNPSLFFEKKSANKNKEAPPLVREMSARWIEPVYAELESLRKAQAQPQLKTAS
jgi:gluconate kinase